MSVMQGRGGVPHVFREGIDTTGRQVRFGREPNARFTISYLIIRTLTAPVRVYFTEADFDANENYILVPVPAADAPYGEWQGPVEAERVWLKGDSGTATVEMVGFQRRG